MAFVDWSSPRLVAAWPTTKIWKDVWRLFSPAGRQHWRRLSEETGSTALALPKASSADFSYWSLHWSAWYSSSFWLDTKSWSAFRFTWPMCPTVLWWFCLYWPYWLDLYGKIFTENKLWTCFSIILAIGLPDYYSIKTK